MDHLLNSRIQVERLVMTTQDGRARMSWVVQAAPLDYVPVRLDMTFVRPGKDVPMPVEAGKAPDRVGLLFARADCGLKAGDRVRAVPNVAGAIPVPGVFEIRVMPDLPQDYSGAHHVEVQVVEVAQPVADGVRPFPGGEGLGA